MMFVMEMVMFWNFDNLQFFHIPLYFSLYFWLLLPFQVFFLLTTLLLDISLLDISDY